MSDNERKGSTEELTQEELAALEELPEEVMDAMYESWLLSREFDIRDWGRDVPRERVSTRKEHEVGRQEFERFHDANPEVWEFFERFCLEMINAGQTGFGAPVIWEHIRWETRIQKESDGPYRLPNQHRPYYARLFQERHPKSAHHIATRALKNEPHNRRKQR